MTKTNVSDKHTPREADSETERKIEEWAEDLGRLLGTARAKASNWLDQREQIAKHLTAIRDTASSLLQQLTGGGTPAAGTRTRRGRPPATTTTRAAGQPPVIQKARRKRTLSAEGRKRIADAQKKRWAALRAAEKK